MPANEFIIIGAMIIVALIFLLFIETFISGTSVSTIEYGYKAEAERIYSVAKKVAFDAKNFVSYCINISLANISVQSGILQYNKDNVNYSFIVPGSVQDIQIFETPSVCFTKEQDKVALTRYTIVAGQIYPAGTTTTTLSLGTTTTIPGTTTTISATTSTTVPQYTFTILYIQLNQPIANFEMMAEGAKNLFVQLTPLKICVNKVRSIAVTNLICNVPDQNRLCNGDSSVISETFDKILGCVNSWGYGNEYTRVVGVTPGNFVCGQIRGYTQIHSSVVVSTEGPLAGTSTHEMGHTFGLCDEGYGNAPCQDCNGGNGICSYGGIGCYPPVSASECVRTGGYNCPNKPEPNSIMCSTDMCGSGCSYAQVFAPTSYAHLERELNQYCL